MGPRDIELDLFQEYESETYIIENDTYYLEQDFDEDEDDFDSADY